MTCILRSLLMMLKVLLFKMPSAFNTFYPILQPRTQFIAEKNIFISECLNRRQSHFTTEFNCHAEKNMASYLCSILFLELQIIDN